jgi:ribonuclease HI
MYKFVSPFSARFKIFTRPLSSVSEMQWILRFDGACKGNPGEGGCGAVLYRVNGNLEERVLNAVSPLPGIVTNNIAEYSGLILGLKSAAKLKIQKLLIEGDSQLIINQLKGVYQVKNANLQALYRKTQKLLKKIPNYELNHIPRESNKMADELSNIAMKETKSKVKWIINLKKEAKQINSTSNINPTPTHLTKQIPLEKISPILKVEDGPTAILSSSSKHLTSELTGSTTSVKKKSSEKKGKKSKTLITSIMSPSSEHHTVDTVNSNLSLTAKAVPEQRTPLIKKKSLEKKDKKSRAAILSLPSEQPAVEAVTANVSATSEAAPKQAILKETETILVGKNSSERKEKKSKILTPKETSQENEANEKQKLPKKTRKPILNPKKSIKTKKQLDKN